MRYVFAFFVFIIILLPTGAAVAQTPIPDGGEAPFLAEDDQREDNPLFEGAGGLPGPYTIPPPPEGSEELTNEFWEYDNLVGMISMFQTVFLLANQNLVVSAFLTIGGVLACVVWIIDLIRRRQDNL